MLLWQSTLPVKLSSCIQLYIFKVGIRRVKMPACLVLSSMDAEAQRDSELGYVGLVELVGWP